MVVSDNNSQVEGKDLNKVYLKWVGLSNRKVMGGIKTPRTVASIAPEDKRYINKVNLLQPLRFGNTLLHALAQIGLLREAPNEVLTKENLLIRNNSGETVAGVAVCAGYFESIPKELIDFDLLTTPNKRPIVHILACLGEFKNIPLELFTEEILLTRNSKGDATIHLLAQLDHFDQVPTGLRTESVLLCKNQERKCALDYLAQKGKFESFTKNLLREEIIFPNKGKKHCLLDSIVQGSMKIQNFEFYKGLISKLSNDGLHWLCKMHRGSYVLEYAQQELTKRKIKELNYKEETLEI